MRIDGAENTGAEALGSEIGCGPTLQPEPTSKQKVELRIVRDCAELKPKLGETHEQAETIRLQN